MVLAFYDTFIKNILKKFTIYNFLEEHDSILPPYENCVQNYVGGVLSTGYPERHYFIQLNGLRWLKIGENDSGSKIILLCIACLVFLSILL